MLDDVPGARGLLAAVFTYPTVQDAMAWTAEVERFIERYAPGLRPASAQGLNAYQVVTTTLIMEAVDAGPRMTAQLNEARSVLLGYTHQLALEAADQAEQGKKRRPRQDSNLRQAR